MLCVPSWVFRATLPAPVTPAEINKRRHYGLLPLGAGTRQPGCDQVSVFECIAVRLQENLRVSTNLATAAHITTNSFPIWAPAISPLEVLTPEEQLGTFFVLIDADDEHVVRVGELAAQIKDLPPNTKAIRAFSFGAIVREFRDAAARAGFELPPRLTLRFGSDEFHNWSLRSAARLRCRAHTRLRNPPSERRSCSRKSKRRRNYCEASSRPNRTQPPMLRQAGQADLVEQIENAGKTRKRP